MKSYVEPKVLRKYKLRGLLNRMAYCARRADETRGETMNLTWLHWNGEYGAALEELRDRFNDPERKTIDVANAWYAIMADAA